MAAAAASAHPFGRGAGSSECCHNSSNRNPALSHRPIGSRPWVALALVLVVAGGQDATVTTTSPSTTSEGTPASASAAAAAAAPPPLASCENPGRKYLFGVKEAETCGLPSARSYLFSKHAAMLVADEDLTNVATGASVAAGSALAAGTTYEARVRACSTAALEREDEEGGPKCQRVVEDERLRVK